MQKKIEILREIIKLKNVYFVELNEARAEACVELLQDYDIQHIRRAIESYLDDEDNTRFPIPITRIFTSKLSQLEIECSDEAWKIYRKKLKNYAGTAPIRGARHYLLHDAIIEADKLLKQRVDANNDKSSSK